MAYEGTIVGDRFEIEYIAGKGGMGAVYRARDHQTGGAAAIKILHDEAPAEHHERLVREARLLAELTHPAFVRHLAFGTTPAGKPWLAMEWLDGEDLAARMKGGGITPAEAVQLVGRVASALGQAHARGVVHRDVKPSNLFLVDGHPDRVKVLDFGIARSASDALDMTRTGAAIGTPRYMAPEQARGARDLDARADVFSLGCVLFECLAGVPPFSGRDSAAIFAKILLEDAPSIHAIRNDLPVELAHLVSRMLAKMPVGRPRDGNAVAAELAAIGDLEQAALRTARAKRESAITVGEQRLVCVVFAAAALRPEQRDVTGSLPTIVDLPADGTTPTVHPRPADTNPLHLLSSALARHRGRGEVLADGSIVVTMLGQGAATDHAANAARCALAIRASVPHAPMALAIGRSDVADRVPLGSIIDRATALVRVRTPDIAQTRSGPRPIRVDETAAGLLDLRFAIEGDDAGLVLARERDVATAVRTLLGKPVPCVGRERELATLGAIFEECVNEPMANIVVVTSPAGVGKSRLRYELVQRLAKSGADIWIGRGDPMSAGAPFAMLSEALRRCAGIVADEAPGVRYRKLRARVARNVAEAEVARVTEFLGELVGAQGVEPSVQLRAARQDPQLMGDQMLRACEDFVAAETSERPLLLVLEDLQWSDVPTVQFVDAIVRRLDDRPLMVLALARPDVDAVFPRLWSERRVERIQLGELTRRAAEKLVREALGAKAGDDVIARLVERASGNAFYLEELIRSVAEGHGDRLPETVVAMAQARIESLEPEARHVLRAASVFGQVFWRGGIASLLEGGTTQVHDWLEELARREYVTARRESRFAGEPEYTFRHSLVREAAYAMLTDRDRMSGHRLAGEWLETKVKPERAGDADALALAEHFQRGGEPKRAVAWYRHAAEQALEGDDLENAIDRADRAIQCVREAGDTGTDADNELVGVLRQLQAGAHGWRGEYALAVARGGEALERLSPASLPWLVAAGAVVDAHARRLEHGKVVELCKKLVAIEITPALHRAFAHAAAMAMTTLLWHGEANLAAQLFAKLDAIESDLARAPYPDPAAMAWIYAARAWRALRDGDPAESLALDQKVEDCFAIVGDLRNGCRQHANVGYGELMLGDFARAEQSLRDAIASSTQVGLHQVTTMAQHNLGLALARQGKLDEARPVESAALARFVAQDNRRLAAAAHNYLALIEIAARNYPAAVAHARDALAAAADKTGSLCSYRGTLAYALCLAGECPAALAEARHAIDEMARYGQPEEGEAWIRLAHAEALHATGAIDDARRAIADAEQRVLDAAAKIRDPARRAMFLEAVVENAATLARARAWR